MTLLIGGVSQSTGMTRLSSESNQFLINLREAVFSARIIKL